MQGTTVPCDKTFHEHNVDNFHTAGDVPSPFYEEPLLRFGDEIYDQCGETILKNEQNAIELNETYYFYQEGYRNLCVSVCTTLSPTLQ